MLLTISIVVALIFSSVILSIALAVIRNKDVFVKESLKWQGKRYQFYIAFDEGTRVDAHIMFAYMDTDKSYIYFNHFNEIIREARQLFQDYLMNSAGKREKGCSARQYLSLNKKQLEEEALQYVNARLMPRGVALASCEYRVLTMKFYG